MFLLGVKITRREPENKAYAKFWGDKQRALWYVVVFSVVVDFVPCCGFSCLDSIQWVLISATINELYTNYACLVIEKRLPSSTFL